MNKHLDPVHNVYVDLDKVDMADMYNNYAMLVDKYREMRQFANELYNVVSEQVGDDWLDDDEKDMLREFEAFRIDPDSYDHVSPSIYCTIIGDDGNALYGEDN